MKLFSSQSEEERHEREAFIASFEEKVHEKIECLELTEFRANSTVYRELHLTTYRPSVWGLLILCEKTAYYYVAPQDSYMSFFTKGAGRTEERLFSLSALPQICFSLPTPSFLSFLNPEQSRSIALSYRSENGEHREACLVFTNTAAPIYAKLVEKTAAASASKQP